MIQHFYFVLFSPLGKLVERAIYFANVFSLFFGRHSRPNSSESNEPIFTKISGLIDRSKGSFTSFSFFDFSRDVAMGTN